MCALIGAGVSGGLAVLSCAAQRDLICRIGVDRYVMLCLELHGACLLIRRVGVDLLALKVFSDRRTLLLK